MQNTGITMLWTARYDYEKGMSLIKHHHDYCQIIYFLDGSGTVCLNDQEYPFSEGGLIFIAPGDIHGFYKDKNIKVRTLDIKFDIYDHDLKELISKYKGFFTSTPDGIASLMEHIRLEGLEKKAYFAEIVESVMLQLLYSLFRLKNSLEVEKVHTASPVFTGAKTPAAARIEEYVRTHYADKISIENISQALGYSSGHITHIFRKSFRTTIQDYVRKYRIMKAKEFMQYSDYTLKEICVMVGFKNIHHFTRVFKLEEGVSPGRWAQVECSGIRKEIIFNSSFENTVISDE